MARGTSTQPTLPTTGTMPGKAVALPHDLRLRVQRRTRRTGPPRDEGASSVQTSYGAHLGGALGVAGETTARTDDETLGEVGSQGVVQAPMADTDTAGTAACEVHAGPSGAEGRGVAASEDFELFATRSESVPGAVDMVGDGPGKTAADERGSTGAYAVTTSPCDVTIRRRRGGGSYAPARRGGGGG